MTNNKATILTSVRMAMAIATVLMTTATTSHAQSQSAADHSVQDANSATQTARPNAAHDPEQKKLFLKKIRQLATHPPLSEEKVRGAFDWPVIEKKKIEGKIGASTTYYNPFPFAEEREAMLGIRSNGGRFFIRLDRQYMCVRSEDTLAEFGAAFKPIIVSVEGWPDKNTLSEAVKENLEKFFWGPSYDFRYQSTTMTLDFKFGFSECLNLLSITETTEQGIK
jgi:hypothetical protein